MSRRIDNDHRRAILRALFALTGSRAAPGAPVRRRWQPVRRVRWLGAVLMVAGCTTVGPDFVPPSAPVLAKWQEADSAVVTRQPAEQVRWWEALHDPVLSGLIEVAWRNNYDLKIAGLRVLAARAQLGIAVGYPLPAGPAGEWRRENDVGQQECRQHGGR